MSVVVKGDLWEILVAREVVAQVDLVVVAVLGRRLAQKVTRIAMEILELGRAHTFIHARVAQGGRRGSDGSNPVICVSPGNDAPDGDHKYVVTYEDGRVVEYDSRYEIDVLSFSFLQQKW